MTIEVIFFDVGNTLVFPNHEKTLAPLRERSVHPTPAQLLAAERTARQEMDLLVSLSRKVDQQYWETYYLRLLQELLIDDASLQQQLVNLARTSSNWRRVRPGTGEVLAKLQAEYRLAVISNSDGGMANLLAELGLGQYFEQVIDSGTIGYEKPDPEIFQAALEAMQVAPEHAVYVGDIYAIDFLGARNVGMNAVLMDLAGVYAGQNLPRIESINDLPKHVSRM